MRIDLLVPNCPFSHFPQTRPPSAEDPPRLKVESYFLKNIPLPLSGYRSVDRIGVRDF